jgi:hypothetical protein
MHSAAFSGVERYPLLIGLRSHALIIAAAISAAVWFW